MGEFGHRPYILYGIGGGFAGAEGGRADIDGVGAVEDGLAGGSSIGGGRQ